MQIEIATLFPEMCEAVLSESIIGRARKAGHISVRCWNIRDYTLDKHRRVDDVPYGGGRGMVMQADPIYRCYEAVCRDIGTKPYVIYMSPKGKVLEQQRSLELSVMPHIFVLCGHYEGVDQRILDEIVDEEVSIGDYVLTGGELPALVLVDTIARMVPGVCRKTCALKRRAISADCWNIPSIPVRRCGTTGRCRRCCSPDTTKTLQNGAAHRVWKRQKTSAPTFMQAIWIKNNCFLCGI